jgi:hypothetical protein
MAVIENVETKTAFRDLPAEQFKNANLVALTGIEPVFQP